MKTINFAVSEHNSRVYSLIFLGDNMKFKKYATKTLMIVIGSIGRNFIILGCVLFITLSVLGYFMEKLDSVLLQVIIAMLALFIEIGWVEFEHNVMKKKMIKKEN